MKTILYIITVIILLSGTISCQKQDETTQLVVEEFKNKGIKFDPEEKLCIILPEVGCEGCIAAGVYFFLQHKESFLNTQKKNKIIFTSIRSKKLLLRNLEEDTLDKYNHILDTENKFLTTDNNSIYPLILILNQGNIVKAQYQSPHSEDIFTQIERVL